MNKIEKIVTDTEGLSDIRKKYTMVSIKYRYENILVSTLKRIIKKEQQQQRRERDIENAIRKGNTATLANFIIETIADEKRSIEDVKYYTSGLSEKIKRQLRNPEIIKLFNDDSSLKPSIDGERDDKNNGDLDR